MKTIDKLLKESNDKIGKIHYLGFCALFVVMLVYSFVVLFGEASSGESTGGDAVIASPFIIIAFTCPSVLCYVLAEKNLIKRSKVYLLLELLIGLLGIPIMYAVLEGANTAFILYTVAVVVLSGVVLYDLLRKK